MELRKRGIKLPIRDRIGFIKLIETIALASVITIWAVYLESFLKNSSYVGFLDSFFILTSILSYFILIPIIEKNNKIKLYILSLTLYVITYLVFAFFPRLWVILLGGIFISFLASLRMTCFGILVRDKSPDKKVSENEGFMYTIMNLSWIIGPLIAGFIANKYGLNKVFIFSAILFFIALILFKVFKIKDSRKSKKIDKNTLKVFIDFFKNKNRIRVYTLSAGVTFWWGALYIYIPMYLIEQGYSDILLGYFLSAIGAPLILSEYYFGKLAGRIGFKKIFLVGYIILGVLAGICFFVGDIYLLLGILVLASFGVAMIEPTTEAYFFDIIDENQRERFYGPYNTAVDFGNLISIVLSAVILLFLPFKFLFALLSLTMFTLAFLSSTIRNIIETRKS